MPPPPLYPLVLLTFWTHLSLAQTNISVDDTSSLLTYHGDWSSVLHYNDSIPPWTLYDLTYHWSATPGDWVSLVFNGTSVEYWSSLAPYNGFCNITIDDDDAGTVINSTDKDQYLDPKLFYLRSDLDPARSHTIKLTVLKPTPANSQANQCALDRFVYMPLPLSSSPASSNTSEATIVVRNNIRTLIGISIGAGGVALIALLFGTWIVIKKCRRHQSLANVPKETPKSENYQSF